MTQPPRRRIEPLSPPPGAFDAVLSRANARRYKRASAVMGVTGVFLAGLVGGVGLAGGMGNIPAKLYAVASGNGGTASTAAVSSPASTSSTAASTTRTSTKGTKKKHTSAPAVVTGGQDSVRAMVHGRAVDPTGAPIAGLYVYTGRLSTGEFVPSATAAAVTGVHGRYSVPCTGGPVMLTDWPINVGLDADAEARWAATLVEAPRCTTSGAPQLTTVAPGGVVTGTVRTDVSCDGVQFPLWLWLGGDRSASVRLSGLGEGDRYRVAGVPAGTSVLGAKGRRTAVTLAVGETVEQDVVFTCPTGPTPTGTPTDTSTATPKPTPSETTTTPTESTPSETTSTSTSTSTSSASKSGVASR